MMIFRGNREPDATDITQTGRNANVNRKPVIFDPVGVGATRYRKESAKGNVSDGLRM